ncbi:GlcG/HbpS family heme-binding protein [Halomonas sp. BC04]|uniref:GlcG/HbpS family heme-binding protein n=1 Tax=Halomonas sp. BC04 TaxID=1403540 RepID=UPI0003ED874D|nr:heme-binding protein [Halomonas sp. BC04]EWH00904.1 GlcG protein [Halomonas sp. BC04]
MAFDVFRRKTTLGLSQARMMITAALAEARRLELEPLVVVVLDSGGQLVSMDREDGAGILRLEIAQGKAGAALGLGVSSGTIGERTQGREAFVTGVASASRGTFVPVPGGVLVLDEQREIIAAVGASGDSPGNDQTCVLAGIHAAGLDAGLDAANS